MDAVRLPPRSASPAASAHRLRFAGYELDPVTGELRRNGEPVPLQPQPARVLAALAQTPGRVVLRQELEDLLWTPEQHVDREQGLNYCIRQVRQALGDRGNEPEFVETLPRRGYRFLPPVERVELDDAAPGANGTAGAASSRHDSDDHSPTEDLATARGRERRLLWLLIPLLLTVAAIPALLGGRGGEAATGEHDRGPAGATHPSAPVPSPQTAPPDPPRTLLAVLPLSAMASESPSPARTSPPMDVLAAGLTEELTTQVGKIDPLRLGVLARSAVNRFAPHAATPEKMAELLGADYVLEGSLRETGDQMRVTVRLIEGRHQTQVWADSFDFAAHDPHRALGQVAGRIAESLTLGLPATGGTAETPDPEAFAAYLQGVYLNNADQAGEAVPYLQRAVELDPGFSRAWTYLSDAYRSRLPHRPEDVDRSRQAAERALALDPDSAVAHLSRGLVAFYGDFEVDTAHRHLRRAVELRPSFAIARHHYAWVLILLGQPERAREELLHALSLDPSSLAIQSDQGWLALLSGDLTTAAAHLRRNMQVSSGRKRYWDARGLLQTYVVAGRWREAAELVAAWPEGMLAGTAVAPVPGDPRASVETFLRGELADLLELSEAGMAPPAMPAINLALLGEADPAIDLLERSVAQRWGWAIPYLRLDPRLAALHANPRFRALTERLNLPDPGYRPRR